MKKRKSKWKIRMSGVLLFLSVLFLTACNGETNGNKEFVDGLNYAAFEPVTEIQEGRSDIYMILKNIDSNYWTDIIKGASDAAEQCDCNVYVGGTYVELEASIQKKLVAEARERGASAILLAPVDSFSMSDTVKELMEEHIPVILLDTILNTDDYTTCLMTDNKIAGEMAAEEMLRQMKEAGVSEDAYAEIGIEVSVWISQTVIERVAGFSEYWTANAPEQWVILDDIKCNYGDTSLAKSHYREYISEHPDLKGLFACNNTSTVGICQELYEDNNTDIIMVGFDYSDEIAKLIASDEYHVATVLQQQYDMGYKGLIAAVESIQGKKLPYKFMDTGVRLIYHDNQDSVNSANE